MTSEGRPRRSPLGSVVLVGAALLGIVLLTGLGIWQVERRAWKRDLIDRVESRIHAAPVAAPGPSGWPAVTAAADEYRRVTIAGHYLNDRETLVQAVTELGAGYWVLTPLETADGATVLVNRGFVPPDRRDPSAHGEIDGETTVTGLMRMTEPKGGFLRANDPKDDRWHSRDVAAIAAARGLARAAPYFIDADAGADPAGFPRGGLTVIAFPNNHLVYALTWFGMAAMLAAVTIRLVREGRVRNS